MHHLHGGCMIHTGFMLKPCIRYEGDMKETWRRYEGGALNPKIWYPED